MNKFNFLLLCTSIIFLTGCSADDGASKDETGGRTDNGAILYEWSFEGDNAMHDLDETDANAAVVPDPLNPTKNKVLEFTLPQGEYRTEVSVGKSTIHWFYCDMYDAKSGDDIWVGFRLLTEQSDVTGANMSACAFQIGPIQNNVTYPNEVSAGHYQLQMNMESNSWRIREFSSIFNPNNSAAQDIAQIEASKWSSFVIHCVFRSTTEGLIEIWKDGTKIYSKQRKNGIAFSRTRIKWGIYIGADNSYDKDVKMYYDDIKIGGRESGYDQVVPKDL